MGFYRTDNHVLAQLLEDLQQENGGHAYATRMLNADAHLSSCTSLGTQHLDFGTASPASENHHVLSVQRLCTVKASPH